MAPAFAGAPIVPTGLIIPFTDGGSGAPSGWGLYTAADGKYIIGAGSTYAVDDNGAGGGSQVKNTTTNGNHTGTGSYADGVSSAGTSTSGNHNHTLTYTFVPPYQQCYLIKSTGPAAQLPQNGVLFGQADLGLTNIWTAGNMFKAAAGVGTGGSLTISGITSSSQGNHNHGSGWGGVGSGKSSGSKYSGGGSHSHSSVSIIMTNTINKYLLSAWQDAAADFDLASGMIAMYESVTPPAGWSLCDGSGGTPDMRDRFVRPITSGSEDSSEGNGTVTGTVASLAHGSHNHASGSNVSSSNRTGYHSNNKTMAAHSFSQNYSWLPPYYALAFIKKD